MKILLLTLFALTASAFRLRRPEDKVGHSLIIDGEFADKGEFPYIIDVRVGGGHYCGGSIYNTHWIITAAHCATQPLAAYRVVAGEHNLAEDDGDEQNREVVEIITHENYGPITLDSDIALMRVSEPFDFNNFVINVSLNRDTTIQSGDCTVAGWGTIVGDPDATVNPDELYKVVLPIVSDDECNRIMGNRITETNICAGDIGGGGSACYGDSGGPLVMNDGSGDLLTGLVSWGAEMCGSAGVYSVYCEVSHFAEWIELNAVIPGH